MAVLDIPLNMTDWLNHWVHKEGGNDDDVKSDDQKVIILTEAETEKEMNYILEDVGKIVHLPKADLHLLLHDYNWKKSKIYEALEKPELQAKFTESASVFKSPSPNTGGDTCGICYSEQGMNVLNTYQRCAHHQPVCDNCWVQYLKIEISEKKNCIRLECPMTGCKVLVGDSLISKAFEKLPHMIEEYRKQLLDNFVQKSEHIR